MTNAALDLSAVGLATALATAAGLVNAAERSVDVTLTECGELDAETVEMVVALELEEQPVGAPAGSAALTVEVVCRPDGIVINADDPLTGKRLEREIPAIESDEAEPERVVALAASQLFRASWLELGALEESGGGLKNEQPDDGAEPDGGTSDLGEVTVEGGARLRALGELLPVAHVGLRGGGTLGAGLGLYGLAAFEYGWVSREIGTAKAYSAWLGLELSHRWSLTQTVSIELGGSLSVGYARLIGESSDDRVITGAIDGLTGEVALLAGPVFYPGDIIVIAIDVQGGYSVSNPKGTVDRGADVSTGGIWVGAMLRVGMRIG
jgi:hypothetical protein